MRHLTSSRLAASALLAVTGVVAGEVQAAFLATSTAATQVRAGKLRPLAVVRKTRFKFWMRREGLLRVARRTMVRLKLR